MDKEMPFKVGDKFSKHWQFDEQSVKEFANLAGDFNPLHHDKDVAEQSRFQRLIVSGTHYVAMMMGLTATYLNERKMTVGLDFDFQLKKAVYADESIDIEWEIVKIEANDKLKGHLIYLSGVIYNGQKEICTVANAKLLSFY